MRKVLLTVLTASLLLTACDDYGTKVSKGHVDIYYKEGIKKENAEQTADFIHEVDVVSQNDTTQTKSMQLALLKDTVTLRMVVNEEKAASVEDEAFLTIANYLSQTVFNNQPVNVDLTDDQFNTIKALHFKKVSLE